MCVMVHCVSDCLLTFVCHDRHLACSNATPTDDPEERKKYSIREGGSYYWNLDFNALDGRGVFSSTPWEYLHVVGLGHELYSVKNTISLIKNQFRGKMKLKLLERRRNRLAPYMYPDPDSTISMNRLTNGLSDFKKVQAQEWRHYVFALIFAIGDGEDILVERTVRLRVLRSLVGLL